MLERSKKGRSVYTRVGFWFDPNQGSIHMTLHGVPNGHVAVNREPGRRNGHPTLFTKLAKALREAGAPAPDDDLA